MPRTFDVAIPRDDKNPLANLLNFEAPLNDIAQTTGSLLNQFITGLGQLAQEIIDMIIEALTGVPVVGGLLDAAFDALNDLFGVANDAFATAFDALGGLGDLIDDLLNNAATVIGSIPQSLVTGLQGALSFLTSAVAGATAFVQQVVDALLSALRGIPIIGGLIPGPAGLKQAVEDLKVQQQNFTITGVVSTNRNPTWMCRYPVGDVTYPEINNARIAVFGVTEGASAGTAHTHALNGNNAYALAAYWSLATGQGAGSYLTITNTTVMDTAGVIVYKEVGTLNNVFLEVFQEFADSSLTRIVSQDISASITTDATYVEVTLPSLLIVQAGERFLIRVRNSSSVATQVWTAGVQETGGMEEAGFYTSGAATTQTSYTPAEAAAGIAATDVRRWGLLASKNMPSTDRSYADDFNRSAIGGLWVGKSSTAALLNIYDNQLGYTGSDDGDQYSIYIHPTTRDVSRVEANLHINADSTAREGVLLHCSRDFTQMVYLGVNSTSAKIYTILSGTVTERASLSVGGTALWSLYYNQAADKYVALKDGSDIGLQWTGVGSAVSHGSDYRYQGARISLLDLEPAGTLDNWNGRDWTIAVAASISAPRMEATAAMAAPVVGGAVNITAPRMSATAAMTAPTVTAEASVNAPRMEATAAMFDPDVSTNDTFPYTFPFDLG
jgi:hypothetical protein